MTNTPDNIRNMWEEAAKGKSESGKTGSLLGMVANPMGFRKDGKDKKPPVPVKDNKDKPNTNKYSC